jgi:hypothetical protein
MSTDVLNVDSHLQFQDAVSSLRSFMTLHTVVTSVPMKELVSFSYRRFRIPEDALLKSLRRCVPLFALDFHEMGCFRIQGI